MLSPESHRISLERLREEISSIDDFYMSDCDIATASPLVQENATRYGPWTNSVGGLDDAPHADGDDDLFTESDDDSSTGEFSDVALTTPENGPSHFCLESMKEGEQAIPCIVDLHI
jgi:hypothetical protein